MSGDDLSDHRADDVGTISVNYHGHRLHEIPPNGQGIAALIALGILSNFDVREFGPDSADCVHLQIEAMKLAFADAHRYVADPKWMDIDPLVGPDVVADAWAPPFARDAFDTVVLDPPYVAINGNVKQHLFRSAAWIARRQVWWFHTMLVSGSGGLKLEHTWLVVVGHSCSIRCLQLFTPQQPKREPHPWVGRGPGMKYNRWRIQPQALPLVMTEER